jgi:uncharacterized protein
MSCLGRAAIVTAACLVLCGPAAAVTPEIKDEGKFFSAETVKKMNEEIREIYRKYDRDLLIETFASLPADKKEKFKDMSKEEKSKVFLEWAKSRAEAAVVKGVYILICKEPGRIETYVSRKERGVFDRATRVKLFKAMAEEFQDKNYEKGLTAAVKFVREKLAADK